MKQSNHAQALKPIKKPGVNFEELWLPGFFWLGCALFFMEANAQQTLNATGGNGTIGGNTFAYSIGEMVLVSTVEITDFYFTQGVLQNDDVNLEIHDNQYLSEGLELYPNPAANTIYLQASFEGSGELNLKLYDLRGRLISQKQVKLHSGIEKQSLDISMLQEGTYLLQAILKQERRVYKHSFKVLKRGNH
jgi:hypothetical protein